MREDQGQVLQEGPKTRPWSSLGVKDGNSTVILWSSPTTGPREQIGEKSGRNLYWNNDQPKGGSHTCGVHWF